MSIIWVLALVGCSSYEAQLSTASAPMEEDMALEEVPERFSKMMPAAPAGGMADAGDVAQEVDEAEGASLTIIRGAKKESSRRQRAEKRDKSVDDDEAPPPDEPNAGGSGETRDWFPETFLWQPLVQVGEDGSTTVDVRVPDQLTSWRVLGLGSDGRGHHAGAVHSFATTLPLYADPVVPERLYLGDQAIVPVHAISQSNTPWKGSLSVRAEGALSGGGTAAVSLPAQGRSQQLLTVNADEMGTGTLSIELEGADKLQRQIRVLPPGRRIETVRSGTLAGPRTLRLPDTQDALAENLQLVVFPGPYAALSQEANALLLRRVPNATGAEYFALARFLEQAPASAEVDAATLRRLRQVGWQRMMRVRNSSDPVMVATLLHGLGDEPGHELAQGALTRLRGQLRSAQRGDGSWTSAPSATLDQVLVETAWCAQALGDKGASLRATGFVERNIQAIKDPYVSAMLIQSGLGGGSTSKLRENLEDGLSKNGLGEVLLIAGTGVGLWGRTPSSAEQLAAAALAVDDETTRGDLLARLLQGWSRGRGFGGVRGDVIALRALAVGIPAAEQDVVVSLSAGGQVQATASLKADEVMVPATLSLDGLSGEVQVSSDSATPLLFVLTHRHWVPFSGDEKLDGVEVEATVSNLRLGQPGTLRFAISAPSGTSVVVEHGLPSGMNAHFRDVGALRDHDVRTDSLRFETRPLAAGEVLELEVELVPAIAGSLQADPMVVSAAGEEAVIPGPRFKVAPR